MRQLKPQQGVRPQHQVWAVAGALRIFIPLMVAERKAMFGSDAFGLDPESMQTVT